MSLSQHISEIVSKAHQRANHIIRCFISGDVDLLIRAFIVYVRPILEYNSVLWSPCLKKILLQQRKYNGDSLNDYRGLKDMPYSDQLAHLNLPTLELHRLHLDLIFFAIKLCLDFGLVWIDSEELFTLRSVSQTRGHAYKLYKSRCDNS